MKKTLLFSLLLTGAISLMAQNDKAALLEDLERDQSANQPAIQSVIQNDTATATTSASTRLFGARDDLTSVIVIIPSGSVVKVLGSDSSYLHVSFEDNDGYIFKKHATIDITPVVNQPPVAREETVKENEPAQNQQESHFTYLENKYGSKMAGRLSAGKIWKGMNSDMVQDSWGTAEKINRVVSGNTIKEEWIYRKTWLYFENNILVDWGARRN
jgi:hypothetical protein